MPSDSQPPMPPSTPFDFDPEDIWIPGFTPIISSALPRLKHPSNLPVSIQHPSLDPLPSPTTTLASPTNPIDASHEPLQSRSHATAIALSTSLEPSLKPGQSILNFPVISRDEWYTLEKIKAERKVEALTDVLERAEQDVCYIQEKKRKYKRERKQMYRKRKLEEEVASGIRNCDEKKRKILMVGFSF